MKALEISDTTAVFVNKHTAHARSYSEINNILIERILTCQHLVLDGKLIYDPPPPEINDCILQMKE